MVHLIDGEEREKIPVKTHFKSARFSAVIKDGNEWSDLHTRKKQNDRKCICELWTTGRDSSESETKRGSEPTNHVKLVNKNIKNVLDYDA